MHPNLTCFIQFLNRCFAKTKLVADSRLNTGVLVRHKDLPELHVAVIDFKPVPEIWYYHHVRASSALDGGFTACLKVEKECIEHAVLRWQQKMFKREMLCS